MPGKEKKKQEVVPPKKWSVATWVIFTILVLVAIGLVVMWLKNRRAGMSFGRMNFFGKKKRMMFF